MMVAAAESCLTAGLSGEEAVEALVALRETIDRLEAVAAGMLAAVDPADLRRAGYASATDLFKSATRMRPGRAAGAVHRARAIDDMPLTKKLYLEGELSSDLVDELVKARDRAPEAFLSDESMLCDVARGVPDVPTLKAALAYWLQSVAEEEALSESLDSHRRRRVFCSRTIDGMFRFDGWLDPVGGETVLRALEAIMPPPGSDDPRTAAQRRADALVDLAHHALACRAEGEARPSIEVHVAWETLTERRPRLAETGGGHVLVAEVVRRLACDCTAGRVVFGPRGAPIEVGARTRTVPRRLRRAVVARDRSCRFPGCRRWAGWCDVHHIVHWAEGGETVLENLILLCRFHHTLIHEGGWAIERTGDGFRFVPDRAPP